VQDFEFPPVRLRRVVTGIAQENCYLVLAGERALLVDPGDDAALILSEVRREGARVEAVLLTHAHFDHVGAVQEVREALGVPVLLHREAREQYARAGELATAWGLPFRQPEAPDGDLEAGDLPFEGFGLRALFTPGHAPGHVALASSAGFVLAGDALFKGSIGRTDLPGSDHATLLESIRRELLALPGGTVVFPGHGPETTVLAEARSNPFLV